MCTTDNKFWCPYIQNPASNSPAPFNKSSPPFSLAGEPTSKREQKVDGTLDTAKLTEGNYSVVEAGSVPPAFRDNGPDSIMPQVARHGGLYSGPESKNPWNSIPVTPTMTNYIQNNLRSANPPPGATEQYVGTPRLGNNYAPMPGVYWYNPPEMSGKHAIMVTHNCDARAFGADGVSDIYKHLV